MKRARSLPGFEEVVRGGPGRGRRYRDVGMVNTNHHRPTMKSTRRRGRVDEAFVLERPQRRMMLRTWTKTAAQ